MALLPNSVILVICGILGLIIAPTTVVQRYKLNKMATFRSFHNRLRTEVNDLAAANDNMANQVEKLQENNDRVLNLEQQLGKVVEQQGGNATQFITSVRENSAVLSEIQKLLEHDAINQVMLILCQVDRDQGYDIDEAEINEMIFRLKSIPGVVDVNEEAIRNALTKDPGQGADMSRIVAFLRKLKEDADASNMRIGDHELAKQYLTVRARAIDVSQTPKFFTVSSRERVKKG